MIRSVNLPLFYPVFCLLSFYSLCRYEIMVHLIVDCNPSGRTDILQLIVKLTVLLNHCHNIRIVVMSCSKLQFCHKFRELFLLPVNPSDVICRRIHRITDLDQVCQETCLRCCIVIICRIPALPIIIFVVSPRNIAVDLFKTKLPQQIIPRLRMLSDSLFLPFIQTAAL